MKSEYGRALSKQLGHFPVWDVGTEVSIGDYGLVDDHCFIKIGNVVNEFQAAIEATSSPSAFWEYTSAGTNVIGGDAGAELTTTGASAKIELNFSAAYSLYIRAGNSHITSISNLAEVTRQLHNHPGSWDHSHYIVSSVRKTSSLVLLMNTSENSSIVLSADPGILAQLKGGRVAGSAHIDVSGDAGLKYFGENGAVYVDLVRVRRLGGKPALAAVPGGLDIKPYEIIDPRTWGP